MRRIRTTATLGAALRAERELQRLTQNQLARRAGLSRATVISVEAGGRADVTTILAIASALKLELSLEPSAQVRELAGSTNGGSAYDPHVLDSTEEL